MRIGVGAGVRPGDLAKHIVAGSGGQSSPRSVVSQNRPSRDAEPDRTGDTVRRAISPAERWFAHLLDQGGMRRTYLKGRAKVQKRYWLQVVAFNLSLVMRKLCGAGKPREFSDRRKALQTLFCAFFGVLWGLGRLLTPRSSIPRLRRPDRGNFSTPDHHASLRTPLFGLCPGMGL